MKTVLHTIRPEQREDVLEKLRVELARVSGLRFAYVYGSVLESDRVHDVDVGIFLDDPTGPQQMNMMDALSVTLSAAVGLPIDIRVLKRHRCRSSTMCCEGSWYCVETRPSGPICWKRSRAAILT